MYNADNFFQNTFAIFKTCPKPAGAPDFTSASGSKYWYGQWNGKEGVFRGSDHAGGRVATCSWWFDKIDRNFTSDCDSFKEEKTGFCAWEDFKPVMAMTGMVLNPQIIIEEVSAEVLYGLKQGTSVILDRHEVRFTGIDAKGYIDCDTLIVDLPYQLRTPLLTAIMANFAEFFGCRKFYFG